MSIAALRSWECRDKYLQNNANLQEGQNDKFLLTITFRGPYTGDCITGRQ